MCYQPDRIWIFKFIYRKHRSRALQQQKSVKLMNTRERETQQQKAIHFQLGGVFSFSEFFFSSLRKCLSSMSFSLNDKSHAAEDFLKKYIKKFSMNICLNFLFALLHKKNCHFEAYNLRFKYISDSENVKKISSNFGKRPEFEAIRKQTPYLCWITIMSFVEKMFVHASFKLFISSLSITAKIIH